METQDFAENVIETTSDTEHEIVKSEINYESLNKEELLNALKELKQHSDYRHILNELRVISSAYYVIHDEEKNAAFEKFLADGGTKDAFEYRVDAVSKEFEELKSSLYKEAKSYFQQQEEGQRNNLVKKQTILDNLRNIVDNEEDADSFKKIQALQDEWKNTGPVPTRDAHELNANYHALLNRFYNNRSIYFELKELDRKKNLEAKTKLCEEAEALKEMESINEAIKKLNGLHEEYKNIGPIPKEHQEELWNRFKLASDAVYEKRNQVVEQYKSELENNLKLKQVLIEKAASFSQFNSDRITEWKAKTDEIKVVQEEWKAIGPVPRSSSKETSKEFWQHSKQFFANKGEFFKSLDAEKEANMQAKIKLCEQVEALQDNENFKETAQKIKDLQQDWKKVGPVARKDSDKIYARFRAACDHFFNKRRESFEEEEKEFVINYEAKLKICEEIIGLSPTDLDKFEDLFDQFDEIGFVPRDKKKDISKKFKEAASTFLEKAEGDEDRIQNLELEVELDSLRGNPNGRNIIFKKKNKMKDEIQTLQSEIDTMNRNIEFFAHSSSLESIKKDAEIKSAENTAKIKELKKKLRILENFK